MGIWIPLVLIYAIPEVIYHQLTPQRKSRNIFFLCFINSRSASYFLLLRPARNKCLRGEVSLFESVAVTVVPCEMVSLNWWVTTALQEPVFVSLVHQIHHPQWISSGHIKSREAVVNNNHNCTQTNLPVLSNSSSVTCEPSMATSFSQTNLNCHYKVLGMDQFHFHVKFNLLNRQFTLHLVRSVHHWNGPWGAIIILLAELCGELEFISSWLFARIFIILQLHLERSVVGDEKEEGAKEINFQDVISWRSGGW